MGNIIIKERNTVKIGYFGMMKDSQGRLVVFVHPNDKDNVDSIMKTISSFDNIDAIVGAGGMTQRKIQTKSNGSFLDGYIEK